jgi:hypothetical protein
MADLTYPTQEQLNTDIVDLRLFKNRIIVAGSRIYTDYETFCTELKKFIRDIPQPFIFYTGMCYKGPDQMVIKFCEENPSYLYYGYPADWDKHGKGAGMLRNRVMADTATHLIAFWDGKSHGTQDMIDVAEGKGIQTRVIKMPERTRRVIRIYTAQMAMYHKAKVDKIKFVDATAKSGMVQFAPDMKNVMAYKNGEMSEEDYTKAYISRMEFSQKKAPKVWNRVKDYDQLIFACYCEAGAFCHRHILVRMIKTYLERNFDDVEVILCGEYTRT